jgi:long-chain acyl-CoA synthetase
MSNLALNLVASAARIPDRLAAIADEHTMTYAELDAASARLATLLEELRQFVKERVTAYKCPRRMWFVESLPIGPTGKLLRREVKPPPSEEA